MQPSRGGGPGNRVIKPIPVVRRRHDPAGMNRAFQVLHAATPNPLQPPRQTFAGRNRAGYLLSPRSDSIFAIRQEVGSFITFIPLEKEKRGMCGRFCIAADPGEVAERYGVMVPASYHPTYNQAPGSFILSISGFPDHETVMGKWGFQTATGRIINARSESIHEKPLFRSLPPRARILIPATGYYEWSREGSRHSPWYITPRRLFSFAGLVRDHQGQREVIILTMSSYGEPARIHHRMPVILSRRFEGRYLSGEDPAPVDLVLPDALVMHPISARINHPGQDDPHLIIPVTLSTQQTLF